MAKKALIYDWNQIPVVVDPPLAGVLLGLHPDTVVRMCASGKIKAFRIGKSWRINRRELMKLCGEPEENPQ